MAITAQVKSASMSMSYAVYIAEKIVEKEEQRLRENLHEISLAQQAITMEYGFMYQGNVYPSTVKGTPSGLNPELSERMFKWSLESRRIADDKAYLVQGLYLLLSHKIHSEQDMFDALPDHINCVLKSDKKRTRPPYWNIPDSKNNKRLIENLSDKAHFYYTLSVIG